ncbi:MAG: class I SAM-dependent methyltransferase [Promethearchaeia archaeon]
MPRTKPFNQHPERYEQWFNKHKYAYKSELLAIKKHLPQEGFGMEVGIGSGKFAKPLNINLGIEPSREMRMLCRKSVESLINSIAESLPFKNEIFDFVLMVTTICFLDDIEQSLNEVYRILKQEGRLIIGLVDRNSPIGEQYQKHKESNVFYKIAEFYAVGEILDYLKIARFSRFQYSQTIFQPLSGIDEIEPIKEGYGEGSFVVIEAIK